MLYLLQRPPESTLKHYVVNITFPEPLIGTHRVHILAKSKADACALGLRGQPKGSTAYARESDAGTYQLSAVDSISGRLYDRMPRAAL
jgi:hypothetical protein